MGGTVSDDAVADSESDGRWLSPQDTEPLFQVGDLEARTEAVVHVVVVALTALLVPGLALLAVLEPLSVVEVTDDATPVLFTGVQTVVNFVALGAVGMAYLYWRRDHSLVGLRRPTRRDGAIVVVGFVGFVGAMFLLEAVIDLLGLELAENVAIAEGESNPEVFLLFIPLQFLFVAPAEELLFRGVIQGLLRRAYGIVPGIALAGLVFAAFHVPALVGTTGLVPTLAILFVTGGLLGALYEYTGTLVVPIVVHALWNATVFGFQYVQAAGTPLSV
jgi:membrane protease YdiL (CAAX protease family)